MSLSSYMNDIKRRKSACRLAHLRLCRKVTHTKEAENNTLLLAHLRPCRKVAHKEKENKPYQRIGSCTLLLAHLRLFRKVTHTHTHTQRNKPYQRILDHVLFFLLIDDFSGGYTENGEQIVSAHWIICSSCCSLPAFSEGLHKIKNGEQTVSAY